MNSFTERADGTAVYNNPLTRVALVIDSFTGCYQVIISDKFDVHTVRHEVVPCDGHVLRTYTSIDAEWQTRDMSDEYEDLDEARAEFDRVVAEERENYADLEFPLPTPRPAHETLRKAREYDRLVAELERTRAELATYRLAAQHATTPGAQL